jgi:hypothetical protein
MKIKWALQVMVSGAWQATMLLSRAMVPLPTKQGCERKVVAFMRIHMSVGQHKRMITCGVV